MLSRRGFLSRTGFGVAALAGLPSIAFAAERKLPPVAAYLQRAGYYPLKLDRDDNNNLLVKGRLGEQQTTFMVDTGWTVTSAEHRLLKGCKTFGEMGVRLDDDAWGLLDWKEAYLIDSIRLSEAEFLNQPVLADSMKTGDRKAWHAVLGLDFLLRNHAIIDCLTGWLCLRGTKPDTAICQAISETMIRSGYAEVPLTPPDGFRLLCQPHFNEQAVRLLVDAGAIFSVLDPSAADKLKLPRRETGWKISGVGKSRESELRGVRISTWAFGDSVAKNMGVGVASLAQWFISSTGPRKGGKTDREWLVADGLLGADHLFEFGVVIDCRQRRMWVNKERMAKSKYRQE